MSHSRKRGKRSWQQHAENEWQYFQQAYQYLPRMLPPACSGILLLACFAAGHVENGPPFEAAARQLI
eukprot:scaffold18479_cov18-Tisochrysis_lutea.AAC.1